VRTTAAQLLDVCLEAAAAPSWQRPPQVSAVHVDGESGLQLSRAGVAKLRLEPRPVTIHS